MKRSRHLGRFLPTSQHELLLGLGQYRVDASLIFCQAGTLGRVGLRLAQGIFSPSG
jgi:hypothetical protein